jgi:hypothetical protein
MTIQSRRLSENFTGARARFDVNCGMVRRGLCMVLGLFSALSAATAQQPHRSTISSESLHSTGILNAPLSLSVYRAKNSAAADSSLLLHNGSVPLWLDGAQWSPRVIDPGYSFVSQWVQMGFTSANFFPMGLSSSAQQSGPRASASRAHSSNGKDFGADGKDSPDEVLRSVPNDVYYGGEVGVLYGRWSGKGGGDMWETYITGTVGNDKFQISAGASYDEWNGSGRGVRFRSAAYPR